MLGILNRFQKSRERRISRKNPESLPAESAGSGPPNGPPLSHWIEQWLRVSAARFKRSTLSTYATVAAKHIQPALGALPMEALDAETLSAFLREKSHGSGEHPALAPSTVCSIVTVLRATLRYAESQGCVVRAWGALRRPALVTGEVAVLSTQERERLERYLCAALDPERLGVLLCMYTGLRLGELCALKWADFSPDCSTLRIRRTIQRIRNPEQAEGRRGSRTVIVFDAPKSRSSNRTIPLPSFLARLLRERRCADDCFLLTGRAGRFVEPRTFQNHFKGILRQAGVREINFHALRHTFATHCVDLGFDVKTLSGILGHADVSVTLNTYVHPSLDHMRQYMERLGRQSAAPVQTG